MKKKKDTCMKTLGLLSFKPGKEYDFQSSRGAAGTEARPGLPSSGVWSLGTGVSHFRSTPRFFMHCTVPNQLLFTSALLLAAIWLKGCGFPCAGVKLHHILAGCYRAAVALVEGNLKSLQSLAGRSFTATTKPCHVRESSLLSLKASEYRFQMKYSIYSFGAIFHSIPLKIPSSACLRGLLLKCKQYLD